VSPQTQGITATTTTTARQRYRFRMPSAADPGGPAVPFKLHVQLLCVASVLMLTAIVVNVRSGSMSLSDAMGIVGIVMLAFINGIGLGNSLALRRGRE
jgi:hypothetical protein